ncbi:MAG: hypothetical protein D6683_05380, partial [Actinomyces sp.]
MTIPPERPTPAGEHGTRAVAGTGGPALTRSTGAAIIACGALATELRAVLASAGLAGHLEVVWLPANLHNRPERIAPAVAEALDA